MLQRATTRAHRHVALFAVLTLGPLVALTVLALGESSRGMRNEVDKRLLAVATDSAALVSFDATGFAHVVESYGQRSSIVAAVSDGKVTDAERLELEPVMGDLARYRGGVTSSGIVDREGTNLTSSPYTPSLVGGDFSGRDWFKGVSSTQRAYVSSAFVTPSRGPLLTTGMAAPIRADANSEIVGYLVAGYSLSGIQERVAEASRSLGVDLTVTDQEGMIVAQPGAVPTALVSLADDQRVKSALSGKSGVLTMRRDGGTLLSAYAPVSGTGWAVITEVSASSALSSVTATRRTILSGAVMLGAVLIAGLFVMARTLRRRAEAEAEAAAARDEAREASRLKSEFLANMSHEIRTPLNGILGMTDLLLASSIRDDEREYAEMAKSSGELLLGIINDILDFSKIEAGRLELENVDFDLSSVIESGVDLFADQAARKGVALSATIESEVPRVVSGDPIRIRQVLLNLIGNAVKFTDDGEVAVSAKVAEIDHERVVVRFEVRDTGPGIAADDRARLFESFTQADTSTTRRFGGSGLGLAISRQLTALMDGEIGVTSEVGVGSTFWFIIPLVRRSDVGVDVRSAKPLRVEGVNALHRSLDSMLTSEAGTTPPTPTPTPTATDVTRRNSVLVVEDNSVNQRVAAGMLDRMGYDVDIAPNGEEAVMAARQRAYDVILMDVQMPGIDGYETTQRIRDDEQGVKRTPIIAMTAGAMKGDRDRCIEAGMDDFVAKPVDWTELGSIVARWIDEASATSADNGGADPDGRTSSHVIDLRTIEMLRSISVDQNAFDDLVRHFIETTNELCRQLDDALAAGDPVRTAAIAHNILGACGTFGAVRLAELSVELEILIRDGNTAEARRVLRSFDPALEDVRRACVRVPRSPLPGV